MPIKNYTTKVPANRSIQEIQDMLVKNGAVGFALKYEQGTGRIESLQFMLQLDKQAFPINLPVNWRAFQEVLKRDRVSRWNDEDYCYRVAWRVIRDWVDAQLAFHSTQMVTIPQIFLPYFVHKDGKTHFEHIAVNPQLLLN